MGEGLSTIGQYGNDIETHKDSDLWILRIYRFQILGKGWAASTNWFCFDVLYFINKTQ